MARVVVQLTESHRWAQADAEERRGLPQPGDVIGVYRDEQSLGRLETDEKFIILDMPNLLVPGLLDFLDKDRDLFKLKRLDLSTLRSLLTARQRQDLDESRRTTLADVTDTKLRAATVVR